MMLSAHTPIHPLMHHGTQQRERLLQQLIPANLKLDDRSIADLIAFAGKLAAEVRYWDRGNQPAGNWVPFWESDLTTLLALIAATDMDEIRTQYRSAELEFLRLEKRKERGLTIDQAKVDNLIRDLVTNEEFGIYGVAKKISDILAQAPGDHAIKKDLEGLIRTQLRLPIRQLIQYHKGSVDNSSQPQQPVLFKYASFVGNSALAAPWGIADEQSFFNLDYVEPFEHRIPLWKLFLKFYRVLRDIVERAERAFRTAIRSRKDHHPHIALFISFLNLFQYLQSDLNSLSEKHLLFYYESVLRLQRRRLIPDKVHVVFQIALNLERYPIDKGTLLAGGTDASGQDRLYEIQEGIVASHVRLVEKMNYYFQEVEKEDCSKELLVVAQKEADAKRWYEQVNPKGSKIWWPLSGRWLYNDLKYKLYRIDELAQIGGAEVFWNKKRARYNSHLESLKARSGFYITSPEIWLDRSLQRGILLSVNGKHTEKLLTDYNITILTDEGVREIIISHEKIPQPTSADPTKGNYAHYWYKGNLEEGEHAKIYAVNGSQSGTALFFINFSASFPNIRSREEGVFPFIRFEANGFRQSIDKMVINEIMLSSAIKNNTTTKAQIKSAPVQQPLMMTQVKTGPKPPPHLKYELHRITPRYEIAKKFFVHPDDESRTLYIKRDELFFKTIQETDLQFRDPIHSADILGGTPNIRKVPVKFTHNTSGWILINIRDVKDKEPPPTLEVTSDDLVLDYYSNFVSVPLDKDENSLHSIHHFNSFGQWFNTTRNGRFSVSSKIYAPSVLQSLTLDLAQKMDKNGVVMEKDTPEEANGNLFLGFENITPGQTLSLLFKTADGTGNPDHFAPDIVWSYLSDDTWVALPPQYIIRDSTLGLKQTGIILLQLPEDIDNGNTLLTGTDGRTDLYWLRMSATEYPDDRVMVDALPAVVDIHVNAATAVFKDNNNSHDHLQPGLPAGTISSLRFRDVNVKVVEQPYASFGGRLSEDRDAPAYYRRIHERLRHRSRAVTIWDYERLLLEEFPKVAIAKCLSHTRRFAAAMPGYVTVAVIPNPTQMVGFRQFYPTLEAGDLEQMEIFLSQRSSYFVSGYGGPGFCCCQSDPNGPGVAEACCCDGVPNNLSVINARFEPIRLRVCVRFHQGLDGVLHTQKLNEAIKAFLAPWATDEHQPLLFGSPIHTTHLLQFLENLDYVDVITDLCYKHFATKASADYEEAALDWTAVEEIRPFTAASVLTTYLDRLNEDNPNVIDHDIHVIEDHDHCSCGDCESPEPPPSSLSPTPSSSQKSTKTDKAFTGRIDNKERLKSAKKNTKTKDVATSKKSDSQSEQKILIDLKALLLKRWESNSNTNEALRKFREDLNELIGDGKLIGDPISKPEEGKKGIHAYRIEKTKIGNRISSLKISLATKQGQFKTFELKNPHLNS